MTGVFCVRLKGKGNYVGTSLLYLDMLGLCARKSHAVQSLPFRTCFKLIRVATVGFAVVRPFGPPTRQSSRLRQTCSLYSIRASQQGTIVTHSSNIETQQLRLSVFRHGHGRLGMPRGSRRFPLALLSHRTGHSHPWAWGCSCRRLNLKLV